MTYKAPLADIAFALKYGASFSSAIDQGLFGELTMDDVDAVLTRSRALRRRGHRAAQSRRRQIRHAVQGRRRHHGAGLEGSLQGLADRRLERTCRRRSISAARRCRRPSAPPAPKCGRAPRWPSPYGPLLTMGAIDALDDHGSDELKKTYLEKLVTGEWTGTMQLTEPQAGSDVGALAHARRARAATAPIASPDKRSSSPMASTISPTTSSTSCWRGCPTRRPARAAFRCSWCRNSCSSRTVRSASATTCARIRSSTSSAFTARRPAP